MDQIRIYTASVPGHMKDTIKILFQGTDEIIDKLLPKELENIRTIADECVELADGVEKKYNDVICLIQELLEACINAKHIYGEDLENVKRKIEENKLREKSAKELNERYNKAMEAMQKQVEEAQEEFKSSMNSLPTGMELVGMEMAESISQALATMGSAVVTMAAQNPQIFMAGLGGLAGIAAMTGSTATGQVAKNLAQPKGEPQPKTKTVDSVPDIAIYSKSAQIPSLTKSILNYINGVESNRGTSEFIKRQFKRISTDIANAPKSLAKEKALSLCNDGIAICEELSKYSPDQKWDEKTTEKLIKQTEKLHQEAMHFDSKRKMKFGVPAIAPTPPMMANAEGNAEFKTVDKAGQQSAGQQASENAHLRIEQSREQLKQCREEYNKAVERMEGNQKELTDILVEMQNCKIQEIDLDTTIKMLVKS